MFLSNPTKSSCGLDFVCTPTPAEGLPDEVLSFAAPAPFGVAACETGPLGNDTERIESLGLDFGLDPEDYGRTDGPFTYLGSGVHSGVAADEGPICSCIREMWSIDNP